MVALSNHKIIMRLGRLARDFSRPGPPLRERQRPERFQRSMGSGVKEQRPSVIRSLYEAVETEAGRRKVADVRIGLGYTGVVLDDGGAGVAYTLRDGPAACCSVLQEAGSLRGRGADEVIRLAMGAQSLWQSIGLAAINAMAPEGDFPLADGNLADLLPAGKDDRVGMVGYFAPLMTLKNRVKELLVLENRPLDDQSVHPADQASELLPTCTVVILTAVTIVNRTFDQLITYCRNAREVVILGPSTPMFPNVFASFDISLLGGIKVVDAPELMRVISEGGGTRHFGRAVRKVNARTPRHAPGADSSLEI